MTAALLAAGVHQALGAPTYGAVEDIGDLDRVFSAIRADVGQARDRAELRRLDHRAGYLVTLTYSRPWRMKFGGDLPRLRAEAVRQFRITAEAINRRARALGSESDFKETWGEP